MCAERQHSEVILVSIFGLLVRTGVTALVSRTTDTLSNVSVPTHFVSGSLPALYLEPDTVSQCIWYRYE